MPPSPLARVRKICLALPGAHEVKAWGEPTFRVNNKLFAMFASANNHHGGGEHAIWVKSTPVNQSLMLSMNPKRFFAPPYVGTSGWVGVRLDGRVNWKELTGILRDAYDLTVTKPKRPLTTDTNATVRRQKLQAKRQLERR
jgi:predicted DNA-binding protein (MmcQ/YjbR family)